MFSIADLSWSVDTSSTVVFAVKGVLQGIDREPRAVRYSATFVPPLPSSAKGPNLPRNDFSIPAASAARVVGSRPYSRMTMAPSADPNNLADLQRPHTWLMRRILSDRRQSRSRLLVVSIGGIGTSSLMDTLRQRLTPLQVDLSDVNDRDGLKHTPYNLLSRGAVASFFPKLVLYVLGHPASAIASHFRRGWPGSQLCLVNPEAEKLMASDRSLNSTMAPPEKVNYLMNYTHLVDKSGIDYYDTYSHATSWLGATELGFTVLYMTLPTLLKSQVQLAKLLQLDNVAQPLFEFPLRNSTSWNPIGKPLAYVNLYDSIYTRLVSDFDRVCASPNPELCASLGLRPANGAAVFNSSLAEAFEQLRTPPSNIAAARRYYIRGLAGICGERLRPKPIVRKVVNASRVGPSSRQRLVN